MSMCRCSRTGSDWRQDGARVARRLAGFRAAGFRAAVLRAGFFDAGMAHRGISTQTPSAPARNGRMLRRAAVLLLVLGTVGGTAAAAQAAGARKVRLTIDYSVGGTYHSHYVLGDCGDTYTEDADLTLGITYLPMILRLQSKAHATESGRALGTGEWNATGTWHDEDCSGSHTQECHGNTG